MAYYKNGKYTQEQITDLLYAYMVEGQSAAYVCKYILGMSETEIGNPRVAWRILQRYYNSYGFKKRYNNGSAFRNISKVKLRNYVSLYWNKNATEKDLIASFTFYCKCIIKEKLVNQFPKVKSCARIFCP